VEFGVPFGVLQEFAAVILFRAFTGANPDVHAGFVGFTVAKNIVVHVSIPFFLSLIRAML
jgi:hypothetical protein